MENHKKLHFIKKRIGQPIQPVGTLEKVKLQLEILGFNWFGQSVYCCLSFTIYLFYECNTPGLVHLLLKYECISKYNKSRKFRYNKFQRHKK